MKFHQKLLCEGKYGKFQIKYIANTDQIALSFMFDGNSTSGTLTAEETFMSDA